MILNSLMDWDLDLFLMIVRLGKLIEIREGRKRKPLEIMAHHWRTVVTLDGDESGLTSINKLKTTPTPNKNGSYGIKGGVRMP